MWGNKAMQYKAIVVCPICGEEDRKNSPSQVCCRKESCKREYKNKRARGYA